MVEVDFCYDFHPGIDEKAYSLLAKKVTAMMLSAPGFVEFRAHRNMVGSPHVRRTSVWQSLEHWARFNQNQDFQALNKEFRQFVTHIDVQIWSPSPYVPAPLRPE